MPHNEVTEAEIEADVQRLGDEYDAWRRQRQSQKHANSGLLLVYICACCVALYIFGITPLGLLAFVLLIFGILLAL